MSCSHPNIIKGRIVSCGKCINCRKKKINEWTSRLILEAKSYKDKVLYITLTYNDDNLPDGGLLSKSDYQKFIKRLRENAFRKLGVPRSYIRYFLCGEYGSKGNRPHYHLILYGLPYSNLSIYFIDKCWDKGFTCIKPFHELNARYVAKYCIKQFAKTNEFTTIDNITGEVITKMQSEFVNMSRRVGLGYCAIDSFESAFNMLSSNFIELGGFKYSVPYSFKRKIKEYYGFSRINTLNILYNENIFHYLDKNKDSIIFDIINNIYTNHSSIKSYDLFANNIKFISFKEYLSNLEGEMQKEKIFADIHKFDYNNFYLNKFDYKVPCLLEQKYFKYTGQKNTDGYIKFLKTYLYNHFNYLFY